MLSTNKQKCEFTIGSRVRYWMRDPGRGFLAVKRGNKDFIAWVHKAWSCCSHLITIKTAADSLRKAKFKNERTRVHMTLLKH